MGFTHFDTDGNAIMVDVSDKEITHRSATAAGCIHVSEPVLRAILDHTAKKGDVLGVARVAGIMATKQTSHLIPLCHPLNITKSTVDFSVDEPARTIEARCTVEVDGKTGVEMEALTGVQVALLTIYDMCKAMDRTMEITDVRLLHKDGGKTGCFRRQETPPVIAVSGVKNVGKTTFLEHLIPLLTEKGLKVAVLKHDGHEFQPDDPGTDTDRLRKAGAIGTAICSATQLRVGRDWTLPGAETAVRKLSSAFPDADLILCEGFKNSNFKKIELIRTDVSTASVCDRETLLAVATDGAPLDGVPAIGLTDYDKAVTLILEELGIV